MGWYPVSPEYAKFPQPAEPMVNVIRIPRGAVSKNNGNGAPKAKTIYKLLAVQAMARCWLDGHKLTTGPCAKKGLVSQ